MEQQAETNLSMDAVLAGSRETLETAAKWQREILRFMTKRISGYLEFAMELRQCRSATDLLNIQGDFLQRMFSDYREGAEWLSDQFRGAQMPANKAGAYMLHSYEETVLKAQEDAAKIIELAKEQAAQIVEKAEERSQRNKEETPNRRGKRAA